MPRITLGRFPRLAALVFAALLGLAIATHASADTRPSAGDCAVLRVQLNGDRPATHTCLAHARAGQGMDPPSSAGISRDDCYWGDLALYQNRNYGGAKLCFTGTGTVNLRNYPIYAWPPGTWSERVSSVSTNDWDGYLYEHTDAGGARLRLPFRTAYPDLGSFWNDRASSLCIQSWTWRCP
jgi:hypothetical protein